MYKYFDFPVTVLIKFPIIFGGLISSWSIFGSVANGYPLSRTSSSNYKNASNINRNKSLKDKNKIIIRKF